MQLRISCICKECYIKKYGELPTWVYGDLYRITDEENKCEDCGKTDFLIYTTEKFEGEPRTIAELIK